MPEAIVKYAVNSTLGTPAFEPLDKMKQICPSDDLLFNIIDGKGKLFDAGEMVLSKPLCFVSSFSGTLRVKGEILTSEGTDVTIYVDGAFYLTQHVTAANPVLNCDVKVNKESTVNIISSDNAYVRNLSVCGNIEDIPRIYPKFFWQNGVQYSKDGSEYRVNSSTEAEDTIFIPSHINGLPILNIDRRAFFGCTSYDIVLPNTIQNIDSFAFEECHNLSSIFLPKSVKTIASNAFENTSMLSTINVEWAQGEVLGAPWGASNATIRYNQTR